MFLFLFLTVPLLRLSGTAECTNPRYIAVMFSSIPRHAWEWETGWRPRKVSRKECVEAVVLQSLRGLKDE